MRKAVKRIVLADFDESRDRLSYQGELWQRVGEANGVYDRAAKTLRALPLLLPPMLVVGICIGLVIGLGLR